MAEIIDLEKYRKQRRRRSPGLDFPRNRRLRERADPAAEPLETRDAKTNQGAKPDRGDQSAD